MDQANKEIEDKKKEAESLLILGTFSIVMAAMLFIGVLITTAGAGRLANFSVGMILLILGLAIALKGNREKKKIKGGSK